MRNFIVASILLVLGCGVQEEVVDTIESAVVSTDPCGVTISPYNPQCTKPGKSKWTCAVYSPTTHRCVRARGKEKIPGSYWVFKPDPNPFYPGQPTVIVYPAWPGGVLTTDTLGQQDAMVVPTFTFISDWNAQMLTYGWSYDTTDLSPSGFTGLNTQSFEYVEMYNGACVALFSKTQFDYSGFLGNWCSDGHVLRIELDQVAYPTPIVRSFYSYQ